MREILFRGKRKDNGEWATATSIFKAECAGELSFYINSLSDATVYFNSDGNITRTETELDCEWLEVIQETVGQFTGLTDKNGKKIFEGDIVRYVNPDEDAITGSVVYGEHGYVGTHEIGFYVEWKIPEFAIYLRNDLGFWTKFRETEVIGNIHDNPELLEEGDS
jgi:uncharacterized phage protein (TIGR01671 family)